MALQTPRQRLQRPSYGNAGSAERVSSSNLSASTAVNRKASLRALTGQTDPRTPAGKMDGELEVGHQVNVPGDMYGTVKFVGSVRGKNGRFVGVELSREFASRGKNDGDVDGVQYFTTTIPGAGIFLPVHRAERRSPALSAFDASPTTPTPSNTVTQNGNRTRGGATHTPPTPALPHKFAQSVGPGARPTSPLFKPKRPSLPRPESPLRRQPPNLAPTPGRTLSQSVRGGRPPGIGSATTPGKPNLRASTTTRPTTSQTPRPYSRTGSRLGHRPDTVNEEDSFNGRATSSGSVPSFSQTMRSPSRLGSSGETDAEIQRLKRELAERDRRLDEQAASLAEMETSVKELSAFMPTDGLTPGGSRKGSALGDDDEHTVAQLRQMVREKNEKISLLTQEFDTHRADFRSTLDSLEMASTETERVYEEQKRDLLAQVAELQELSQSKEDFEGVARQLKQLEELVQELEEGLEESRRGEAEARGEVEFLRGEVERGRFELRREREKAASSLHKNTEKESTATSKEVEQRDDEIRGLKAIIHSMSSTPHNAPSSGDTKHGYISNEDEVHRLQSALEASQREKDDLETELERLRRETAAVTNGNGINGHHSSSHVRNESERTATHPDSGTPIRTRSGTLKPTFAEHARRSGLEQPTHNEIPSPPEHHEEEDEEDVGDEHNGASVGGVYCEMCESADHDTLDCDRLENHHTKKSPAQHHEEEPYSPGKENGLSSPEKHAAPVKVVEEDKWCALCEKDGHLAFDCPEEQY